MEGSAPPKSPEMVPVEVLCELVHDLRSPLVAAAGFLNLLERTDDDAAAKRYVASLHESIELLGQMLDRTRSLYCRTANH